jgi:hypothetical protein
LSATNNFLKLIENSTFRVIFIPNIFAHLNSKLHGKSVQFQVSMGKGFQFYPKVFNKIPFINFSPSRPDGIREQQFFLQISNICNKKIKCYRRHISVVEI